MTFIEEIILGIIAINALILMVLYYLSLKKNPDIRLLNYPSGSGRPEALVENAESGHEGLDKGRPKKNWDMSDGDLGI